MDTIRVGVIGAGGNTKGKHIPLLQGIEGVEIVSVCNRSKASGEAVAKEFNIPQVHEDWRALVQSDDIDAVVIGTWPNMHHDCTIAALEAGKHVMVEARIGRSAAEAEAMLAASQAKPDLVCQVVPAPFTFAVDKTVRKLILENHIGAVLAIDVRFTAGAYLNPTSPLSWRQDKEISGNNIMGLGICYESVMRWLGEAESVLAHGETYVTERKNADGETVSTDIPEHLDVLAHMHCGASAHFRMSAMSGHAAENEFRIIGSEGCMIIRGQTLLVAQKGDDDFSEYPIAEKDRAKWRVEEEFIGAIRGTESIRFSTFACGVRYMRFSDAVTESLATGQRQLITPFPDQDA